MEQFQDIFDNLLKLTDTQWNHIKKEHPEVETYKNRISDVLRKPDFVKRSKREKDTFLYYRFYKDIFDGKYFLVVANTKDYNNILTCYITNRVKEGDFVWEKN